jgi:hypothetical protein
LFGSNTQWLIHNTKYIIEFPCSASTFSTFSFHLLSTIKPYVNTRAPLLFFSDELFLCLLFPMLSSTCRDGQTSPFYYGGSLPWLSGGEIWLAGWKQISHSHVFSDVLAYLMACSMHCPPTHPALLCDWVPSLFSISDFLERNGDPVLAGCIILYG